MNWSPISARFQGAGRYAAIALGASIPISVALDNLLFLVVVLAWLLGGRLSEKLSAIRANPAALAALGFFALLLLGMTWSPPGSARDGWYFVAKYKDLVLVALLAGLVAGEHDKRFALAAFLAAMALTLVLSYAIWLGVLPVQESINRGRANPTVFKLHVTHGVLMAFAAFLAAAGALRTTKRSWRVAYSVGAALAAFNVLFMVHGRTGYLVLAVLAVYLGFARWRWRGAAVAAAAMAVAVGAAQIADAPFLERVTKIEGELQEWDAGRAGATSTGLRMNYYRTTAAIVRDHPVLGVGTGGFVSAYREKVRGTGLPESNNPHNQYLLTAAQLGAVGLLALVAMFLIMWRQAGRLEPAMKIAARGLVLTIAVGCLLNSFLIDHVEGLLFAWMAGLLLAAPGPAVAAPRTIVLITLRRLGDVLLATPLLRSLRRAYPDASIDVLVYAGQEGILEGNPDCNRVVAVEPYPGRAGYAKLLRGNVRRYDLALTTQANDRSHVYAWLLGRRRVGLVPDLRWSSAWKRASCSAYAVLDDVNTHTVVQNLVLADLLGIARHYEVVPPRSEDAPRFENYVVLHPYPKFNYKQWTREGWERLIRWLRGQGLTVVLSGGNDRDEKAHNAALASGGGVVNLTGKLALGALATLYRNARLYVGPDTSTTHIAAACGVPTLALFGPTNPVKWGPWPAGHASPNPYQRRGRQRVGNVLLLQGVQPPDLARCVPCHLEGCERHVRSFSRCLTEMPLDPVSAAAEELLRS